MTDQKTTKALLSADFSDPSKFRQLESGAVISVETGKIVTNTGGRYTITPELGREYARRRAVETRMEYLQGIILGRGEEPREGATLEELEEQAGESKVQMWAHWFKTFLKSSNLRGMSDSGKQLLYGPGQAEDEEKPDNDPQYSRVILLLAELSKRKDAEEVIDAESDG